MKEMSRFKKCDSCGCNLTKKNMVKVKSIKDNLGQYKRKDTGSHLIIEAHIVVFMCIDCKNFHESENGKTSYGEGISTQQNSELDKIITKKANTKSHNNKLLGI